MKKIKQLTVRVKATVTKDVKVKFDITGMDHSEIEQKAYEMANEKFNILNNGEDENYEQDATLITNLNKLK